MHLRSTALMALVALSAALAASCGDDSVDPALVWGDPVEEGIYGTMVDIPASTFTQGCDRQNMGCSADEVAKKVEDQVFGFQVSLSAYSIDKTEVTRLAYRECVEDGRCTAPRCNWDPVVNPNRPVVCVSFKQASDFCAWSGKRLPTEAEWEFAARGDDGRKFPWGDENATCALAVMDGVDGVDCGEGTDKPVCVGCGTGSTVKVCSRSPAGDSPFGLCDMAGNAWEWVSDWYGKYPKDAVTDPKGPDSGEFHVSRGGGIYDVMANLRTTNRYDADRMVTNGFDTGFRCAGDAD
ncbi:MAG TPA: SUMF1/EgtB/PvdO family nonheme iron enzyme [Myxococcota bacterium]|nr:SUMF1/EgtB/PvdO family nonheme iron enzyme [Myxococcota bacterium]HOA13124.1 SUMF1/EgtB/PvdO family nonheme iron enzyme [Myxococcota bacterium]HOH76018.1 SUMF1/EgtB/PvdO family nonheme iron enzyme [Myxococcota bacterium]HPV04132.1 SUMF1/EgtB/PvdO family nonheme iron enzyme [Myxococcota bacterium]